MPEERKDMKIFQKEKLTAEKQADGNEKKKTDGKYMKVEAVEKGV